MRGFHPWLLGMIIVFVGAVLFMTFALYGMMAKNAAPAAIDQCKAICTVAKKSGIDLTNGPCLSEMYPEKWDIPDWVCDVAHAPRQPVDNLPENQCSEFREGKAHHFVEVDENCKVIRIY